MGTTNSYSSGTREAVLASDKDILKKMEAWTKSLDTSHYKKSSVRKVTYRVVIKDK